MPRGDQGLGGEDRAFVVNCQQAIGICRHELCSTIFSSMCLLQHCQQITDYPLAAFLIHSSLTLGMCATEMKWVMSAYVMCQGGVCLSCMHSYLVFVCC